MIPFALIDYLLPMVALGVTGWVLSLKSPAQNAPVLLLIGLWIFIFTAHAAVTGIALIPLYPSGIVANSYVTFAVIALALAFVMTRAIISGANPARPNPSTEISPDHVPDSPLPHPFLILMLALYAILVLLLMVRTAIRITGTGDVLSSMQYLRFRLNYDAADWGIVKYLSLSVTAFSVYAVVATRGMRTRTRWPVYIAVFCAITMAVISTQRTAIFMILIALAFAPGKGNLPSLRTVMLLGIALIIAFLGVGYSVGKAGTVDLSLGENLATGFESFLLYMLTPLSALSQSEIWAYSTPDGSYSLRFFTSIAAKLGLFQGDIKPLVMEYSWVPGPTNVYTFVYVALADFGAMFFVYYLFVGAMLGVVFSLPRRSAAIRTIQGFCYYPIIMTLYQDQFLTITSQWIQIIIFVTFAHAVASVTQGHRKRQTAGETVSA